MYPSGSLNFGSFSTFSAKELSSYLSPDLEEFLPEKNFWNIGPFEEWLTSFSFPKNFGINLEARHVSILNWRYASCKNSSMNPSRSRWDGVIRFD